MTTHYAPKVSIYDQFLRQSDTDPGSAYKCNLPELCCHLTLPFVTSDTEHDFASQKATSKQIGSNGGRKLACDFLGSQAH